ncbi:unnamed protein product, partial [Didymodactylos carnosus]
NSDTHYLENLIENYFIEERLDCYCDECKTTEEKLIRYNIAQLPRVFVLYLKRWHVTKTPLGELESVSKEDQEVYCSLNLNMKPYCTQNVQEPKLFSINRQLPILKDLLKQRDKIMNNKSPTMLSTYDKINDFDREQSSDDYIESKRSRLNDENINIEKQINNSINPSETINSSMYLKSSIIDGLHADYRLFALINHHGGSSDVGHYTSTVYDCQQNVWWSYDDTSVSTCTEEKALKDLAPNAYGVMYIHKDVIGLFEKKLN